MTKCQFHEQEYAMFWKISVLLLQAARDNHPKFIIDAFLEELEGICVNTEQVTLRKRCEALLAQFRVAEAAGASCTAV